MNFQKCHIIRIYDIAYTTISLPALIVKEKPGYSNTLQIETDEL